MLIYIGSIAIRLVKNLRFRLHLLIDDGLSSLTNRSGFLATDIPKLAQVASR